MYGLATTTSVLKSLARLSQLQTVPSTSVYIQQPSAIRYEPAAIAFVLPVEGMEGAAAHSPRRGADMSSVSKGSINGSRSYKGTAHASSIGACTIQHKRSLSSVSFEAIISGHEPSKGGRVRSRRPHRRKPPVTSIEPSAIYTQGSRLWLD